VCGRVKLEGDVSEIRIAFRIPPDYPTPNFAPSWNVAPTDQLPIVRYNPKTQGRTLDLMRWGLVPYWAKDIKVGFSTINAMAETIDTKPVFREAFRRRRCLVPVEAYYEWQKLDAKTKQPYAFALAEGGFMALAGLWETWKSPAGEVVRSFTIATTDLALYALCSDLIGRGYRDRPLDLRASEVPLRSTLNDLAGTPADRLLTAREAALDTAWLDLPPVQSFAALSALPNEAKQRLFAWCIALTLKPQLAIEDRADPVIETAGRHLAIPFADLWRPDAANYWGRVKKAHALDIAKEVLGPRWARDHELDRKPVLAEALETAFDPEASAASIHLEAVRDQAAAWLPPGFAYAVAAEIATEDTAAEQTVVDVANDPAPGETGEDGESDDIPAFLTADVPEGARPNGAALS
jgi:hypothetical protein